MKRLLRLELKKALKNRFFVLSVSIMTLFAVLSAVYMYQNNSAVLYGIVGERFAENGKLVDWKAYCNSTSLSCQVVMKDPTDEKTRAVLEKVLYGLRNDLSSGVESVCLLYTSDAADEL